MLLFELQPPTAIARHVALRRVASVDRSGALASSRRCAHLRFLAEIARSATTDQTHKRQTIHLRIRTEFGCEEQTKQGMRALPHAPMVRKPSKLSSLRE